MFHISYAGPRAQDSRPTDAMTKDVMTVMTIKMRMRIRMTMQMILMLLLMVMQMMAMFMLTGMLLDSVFSVLCARALRPSAVWPRPPTPTTLNLYGPFATLSLTGIHQPFLQIGVLYSARHQFQRPT